MEGEHTWLPARIASASSPGPRSTGSMARRADKVRIQRQRQSQIGIGLAILLVVAGVGWVTNWYGITSKSKPRCRRSPRPARWTPVDTTTNADLKATGVPPVTGRPPVDRHRDDDDHAQLRARHRVSSTSAEGAVRRRRASRSSPASSSSTAPTCQRLDTAGPFVLQCGDPSGNGDGGPAYTIPDENLPTDFAPAPVPDAEPERRHHPRGDLPGRHARDRARRPDHRQVTPDTGGSQFLLVYKDSPLAAELTRSSARSPSGLDVVQKIADGRRGRLGRQGADRRRPEALGHRSPSLTVSPISDEATRPRRRPTPSTPASSKS